MIPNVIHYCWFGKAPKPPETVRCIKSWKKYCEGWKIIEWNEENVDFSQMPKYVQDAFQSEKWAFVSDYVRLWAVYNYGGGILRY